MKTLMFSAKWMLVALSVVAWIVVVPLIDPVVSRFGRVDEAKEPAGDRTHGSDIFPRAA